MKKLIGLVAIALISVSSVFAQTPATVKQTPNKVATKTTTTAAKTVTAKTDVKLKADGTPDRRYKAAAKIGNGPKKADGTPDMRYKANKK